MTNYLLSGTVAGPSGFLNGAGVYAYKASLFTSPPSAGQAAPTGLTLGTDYFGPATTGTQWGGPGQWELTVTAAVNYYIGVQYPIGSTTAQWYWSFDDSLTQIKGDTGAQGAQGATGSQGSQGSTGAQGSTGTQGVQGTRGYQGYQGYQGVQGSTGATGSQGAQGVQGSTGSTGAQGATGAQGTQGNQGNQGYQGTQGLTGSTGAQGTQGFQGTQGVQGNQGFQGSTGSQGVQGSQGSTGSQGNQGFQGVQGTQGYQGYQGYQGVVGSIGPQGAGGTSAYYGNFYSSANQTLAAANTAYAMTLNGDYGSAGVSVVSSSRITFAYTGEYNIEFSTQIARSNSGTDTVDIWLRKNGTDVAMSDTQVVVTGGVSVNPIVAAWNFVVPATAGDYYELMWSGTDNHIYLAYAGPNTSPTRPAVPSVIATATLITAAGATGAQGAQGAQGAAGTQGTQGNQGFQGSTGATGSQGNQGFQGTAGTQGTQGATGAQGSAGAQGAQGSQGFQGYQGANGAQGTQGTAGAQGTTGAQGSQGIAGTQGNQGSTGAQGTQGYQGAQGSQGNQGNQGSQGTSTALATVNLTTQSAAQAATTLYTPASDGLFTITYYAKVTTAATTSSTLGVFSVISTDTDSNVVTTVGQSSQQNSLTAGFISGSITVYAKASTAIQYSLGYASSGATAMQYELHVVVAGTIAPSSTGTVSSFNGRTGAVTPGSSDYTASQVGAVSYLSTQAGKNILINGGLDIWQRGTTFTNPSGYTADRWFGSRDSGQNNYSYSQQTSGGITGLPNYVRIQRTSGDTQTGSIYFNQSIETTNSYPMANQTVTLSFWAKAGANYSATSSAFYARVLYGATNNIQMYHYTSGVSNFTTSFNLTTSWQQFTYTVTIPSTSTQVGVEFQAFPTGTAGANDYVDFAGCQLEIGSTATAFSRAGGTIQGELAACQRYLPAFYPPSSAGADFFLGYAYATNSTLFFCNFNVPARVPPTGITPTGTFQALALNSPTTVTPSFNSANQFNGSILASQTITAGQGSRMTMAAGALLLFTGCEL